MKKYIWGNILYFLGIFGLICNTYFPVDNLGSIRNGSYILFPLLGLISLIIMSIGTLLHIINGYKDKKNIK